MTTSHFKQFIDMLAQAKIKYGQVDHGNGRSTLVINGVNIDFERGRLIGVRAQ